jgi:polyisoprenoid-binding protein YceI
MQSGSFSPGFSRPRMLLMALGIAVLLAPAFATAQSRYHIDPGTSQVQFSLGGSHEVNGQFHVSSGDLSFDPKTGAMKGIVLVEAGSGSSDNKSRDKKMRNDELKADMFPTITFSPTHFDGTLADSGDSNLQVEGTFTLIGQSHAITVPMAVHIDGNECTAKGEYTIPYVAWGMKDPSMFLFKEAKDVKIDLTFHGTLSR